MGNRFVPALLIALLVVVHLQLWRGRGSAPDVARLRSELATQNEANDRARLRNDRLESEVRDLKEGMEMVEEKARSELGMVKSNEIFVHVAPESKNTIKP